MNVDETTYMFSPKVLDRANTIEFRINRSDMEAFLDTAEDLNLGELYGSGSAMAGSFLEIASERTPAGAGEYTAVLNQFFVELQKAGAEFGYRSAGEMLRFIYMMERVQTGYTSDQKVDLAILQKVLPKLHGSRRKLCPVLVSLTKMCLNPDSPAQNQNIEQTILLNAEFVINEDVIYPNTLEKLIRMYRSAVDLGFTSFAEA